MPEEKGIPAVVVVGGALVLAGGALALVTMARAAPGGIALSAGWNEVVYTGKEQTAEEAFDSIISYLEIAYYLDDELEEQLVTTDHIMEPGEIYYVSVTQDCIWTF